MASAMVAISGIASASTSTRSLATDLEAIACHA